MTAHVTCNLVNELSLDPKNTFFRVSKRASTIGGTSAMLREG